MSLSFTPHHCTLSVRSSRESAEFYGIFGFGLVLQWEAADGSLAISHLTNEDFILELFEYRSNGNADRLQLSVGNDLERLGVKHIAFKVDDIEAAAAKLTEMRCGEMTSIQHGRTGIDYFFIADPDGNWVEIVQDNRALTPERPTFLPGA